MRAGTDRFEVICPCCNEPAMMIVEGEQVDGLPASKSGRALRIMLERGARGVSSDELVDLLWRGEPSGPPRHARKVVHTTVYYVRRMAPRYGIQVRTDDGYPRRYFASREGTG